MGDQNNTRIGRIGESIVVTKLLKMGVPAELVRLGRVDVFAIRNEKPLRIQVKATSLKRRYTRDSGRGTKPPVYHFSTSTSIKGVKTPLTKKDVDIVALVAVDIERIIFHKVERLSSNISFKISPKDFCLGCEENTWKKCFHNKDERLKKTL